MAELPAKEEQSKKGGEAVADAGRKPKKKDAWPTNCVQSNKRIRRKDWYYRDGKFFANKKNYKLYIAQGKEKKAKSEEAQTAAKA